MAVAFEINTAVNVENTSACMKPTKVSSNKNGNEANIGSKKAIIVKRTSPAKMFPNNRNEKERILENSETTSNKPVKKDIGLEKLKNLLRYLVGPKNFIPKYWMKKKAIRAKAKVVFKSLVFPLSSGTKCVSPCSPPTLIKILPIPGKSPNQLSKSI